MSRARQYIFRHDLSSVVFLCEVRTLFHGGGEYTLPFIYEQQKSANLVLLFSLALSSWLIGLQDDTSTGLVLVCVNLITMLSSLFFLVMPLFELGPMFRPQRVYRDGDVHFRHALPEFVPAQWRYG